MSDATVTLDGARLTCEQVRAVARDNAAVSISQEALVRARAAAETVREWAASHPVYGRSTGVGANRSVVVPEVVDGDEVPHGLRLLRSHAGGAGPLLDEARARGMLVVRLNQLAAGGSGVDPGALQVLTDALNAGCAPAVPSFGAIGTGDLTALAAAALCMLGERAWIGGELPPYAMDAGDALGFISSNAATIGEAALACAELQALLPASEVISALTFLAVDGSLEAYAGAVHEARPHPGQLAVAARLRQLLAPEADRPATRIQDPFGLRAVPQVHGPAVDAVAALDRVLAVELNAAAENPLVDVAGGDILHNANFHTAYVSLALDATRTALYGTAALSTSRLAMLVEPAYTGLRPFLADGPEGSSGVMITEYVAQSALATMRQCATPAALGTAMLSRGTEDHASFSTQSARSTTESVAAYRVVLACELVAAVRALRMRDLSLRPGPLERAWVAASTVLDPRTADRALDDDIAAAVALLPTLHTS